MKWFKNGKSIQEPEQNSTNQYNKTVQNIMKYTKPAQNSMNEYNCTVMS